MFHQTVSKKRIRYEVLMRALMLLSVGLTVALVLFLLVYVLLQGIPNITWELLSTSPSYLTDRIGILPDILNTIYIVLATLMVVLHHDQLCGNLCPVHDHLHVYLDSRGSADLPDRYRLQLCRRWSA